MLSIIFAYFYPNRQENILNQNNSVLQGCVLSGLSSLLTQISGLAPTLSTFVVIVATAAYVIFEGKMIILKPSWERLRIWITASLSHLRTMLPESSSLPFPAKWPNHAT